MKKSKPRIVAKPNKNGGRDGVVGFLVETHDDLDRLDPSAIAIQMAQHMENVMLFRQDSIAFAERALVDEEKATKLDALVLEVEARARGETVATSRMDRISSYDPDALRAEAKKHREQAQTFRVKAQVYSEKVVTEELKMKEAQALVMRLNARQKQRKADKQKAIASVIESSQIKTAKWNER